MSHQYEVLIRWSDEDRAFVAGVPELPGCMAHGSTRAAARENIEQAIELWLETAGEYGDPVPEPRGNLGSGDSAAATSPRTGMPA